MFPIYMLAAISVVSLLVVFVLFRLVDRKLAEVKESSAEQLDRTKGLLERAGKEMARLAVLDEAIDAKTKRLAETERKVNDARRLALESLEAANRAVAETKAIPPTASD